MVRKFLYFVAFCIVLFIAGTIALSIWSKELTEIAFAPAGNYAAQDPLAGNAYEDPEMWISRPGKGANDPSAFRPEGAGPEAVVKTTTAVFFVHPTTYLARDHWNAPLDDAKARQVAETFTQGLASPFNRSVNIWAPRYRQAAVGAFLTDKPDAAQAFDAAYRDVAQAFDYFAATVDEATPIVLVGHSQGAMHVKRLLAEKVAGTPLADRVIAAYIAGWPVSKSRDLPAMGLPACATASQSGCVLSWQSFAEPADPKALMDAYERGPTLDGEPLEPADTLCTNPLTGSVAEPEAPESANLGTLVPNADMTDGAIVVGAVPARCDDRGLLLIGNPPAMGSAVLPGNNYHVYDIPLFWANLRADFARREAAWLTAHGREAPSAAPTATPSESPATQPAA